MPSAASKVNPSAVTAERLRWREATLSWLVMEALFVDVILNDWKAPALQDLEEETSGTKAWEQEPVWCAPGAGGGRVSRKLTQVHVCVCVGGCSRKKYWESLSQGRFMEWGCGKAVVRNLNCILTTAWNR